MSQPTAIFYIVTPSFNQAQFLKQTIDSVLAQHSRQIEVQYVVMDAKSTDESVEILRAYGKEVRWKSEKDEGQTDAINKGLSSFLRRQESMPDSLPNMDPRLREDDILEVFAYINSDDYYLPEAFIKVVEAFQQNPDKQWVVGDAVIIDEHNKEIQRPVRWYKQFFRTIFPSWILFILNPYPQPATFIKWEAIQQIGLFNTALRYTMDYEYWLRLRKTAGEPILLAQPLAAFRIHGLSKGGSQFTKQFQEELQVAQRYTSNPVLIGLHSLHNRLIQFVYGIIK